MAVDVPLTEIPRAALKDLIVNLAQVNAVIWDGESEYTLGAEGSFATLNVSAYGGKGTDEARHDYDTNKDQAVTTSNGVRLFTLSIRVDSYSFDRPAYETLEQIRRRIRGGAARQLMQQEGLALVRIYPIQDLDKVADTRPIYCSAMDIRFAFAVSESDTTATGDYIAGTGSTPAVPGTLTP